MGWKEVLLIYSSMAAVVGLLRWGFARSDLKLQSESQLKNFTNILKEKHA